MANRTESVRGVWGDSANTTIPSDPTTGLPYRDTGLTLAAIEEGWPYKQVVESAALNQALYELYAVLQSVEKNGSAQYSELTDYEIGGTCTRDDGTTMQAVLANGPASTLRDPNTDSNIPQYWKPILDGLLRLNDQRGNGAYALTALDFIFARTVLVDGAVTVPTAMPHEGQCTVIETTGTKVGLTVDGSYTTVIGSPLANISGGRLITVGVIDATNIIVQGATEA